MRPTRELVCCPHDCHFNAPAQGDPPKATPKHMNKPTCSEATDKMGTGSQQRLSGDDRAVSTQLGRTQSVLGEHTTERKPPRGAIFSHLLKVHGSC